MGSIIDVNGDMIETHHYDHSSGKSYIGTSQNVKPYLEQNSIERLNPGRVGQDGMRKIASIPMSVIEQWNTEIGGNILKKENRPRLMAKIKDRNYSKFRTSDEKL